VKLADLQADVNSPLYSVKTFEELPMSAESMLSLLAPAHDSHDHLKKGIYAAGFKKPSKIQERALPMLLNNPSANVPHDYNGHG
jgi:ATP-dependent RNA helicase DDX19/DBP5